LNIKITYNWLLEYLDTDATVYELQKYLSLCGPSFETLEKIGSDYVFDIEITSNRVDIASVFGIAQEATAILPQFGKKAKIKANPLAKFVFKAGQVSDRAEYLDIDIKDDGLISRFTTALIKDIKIEQSPKKIKERLEACGIQSINNIVDISNYIMLSLGQPTHMFDYDKIKNHKMVLRKSKKNEELVTLDGKKIKLPGDDIVIEDGSGRIIDLCGIMGGENSEITESTRNVLFFVQTYDKKSIRRTSMTTGQRTVAATYFEKGLDESRVENAIMYGLELIAKNTSGKMSGQILDIYKNAQETKSVKVYLKDIYKVIGIVIDEEKILSILNNLGFQTERHEDSELAYPDGVSFSVKVPSFRDDDINQKEDIIEEIARVYGYHNLPNNIAPQVYIKQPKDIESIFRGEGKIKKYLKHIGFHEFLNYSMISKSLLENLGFDPKKHLKIANTISEEIEYMRTMLVPSVIKNIKDNFGYRENLRIFEIAKIYLPKNNDLPEEKHKIAFGTTTDFFKLKGSIEGLFGELNIETYSFEKGEHGLLSSNQSANILIGSKKAGFIGQLKLDYQEKMGINAPVYIAEIELLTLVKNAKIIGSFKEPSTFAVIKLDATIENPKKINFAEIKNKAFQNSNLLTQLDYLGKYNNNISLRLYFSSNLENITENQAKSELDKILKSVN